MNNANDDLNKLIGERSMQHDDSNNLEDYQQESGLMNQDLNNRSEMLSKEAVATGQLSEM